MLTFLLGVSVFALPLSWDASTELSNACMFRPEKFDLADQFDAGCRFFNSSDDFLNIFIRMKPKPFSFTHDPVENSPAKHCGLT